MKVIFNIYLLFIPLNLFPSENLSSYNYFSGGIDNYHESSKIADTDFQDARNVLTDKGYLEKRPGSDLIITGNGDPIIYQKEFTTQSNVKNLIIQAGQNVYVTDFSTSPVLIATVNINGILDGVSAFNRHFMSNGYDTSFFYDGSSVSTFTMPTSKYLEFAYERLWAGNIAGYESRVDVSEYGDYNNWEIPTDSDLVDTDPISFYFDRNDGKPISCLYASPYGVLVFKRNKMFIIRGNSTLTFSKARLSDSVGCVDDRSVHTTYDGRVRWLGFDGIYEWSGGASGPTLISREIDKTIKTIKQSEQIQDLQQISSYADWKEGDSNYNGPTKSWSADISPGNIVLSTFGAIIDDTNYSSGTFISVTTTIISGYISISTDNKYPYSPNDYFTKLKPDFNLGFDDGTTSYWTLNNSDCPTQAAWLIYSDYLYAGIYRTYFNLNDNSSHYNLYARGCKNEGPAYMTVISTPTNTVLISTQAGVSNSVIYISTSYPNYIKVNFIWNGSTRVYSSDIEISTDVAIRIQQNNSYGSGYTYYGLFIDIAKKDNKAEFVSPIYDTGFLWPSGGSLEANISTPTSTSVSFAVRDSTSPNNDMWSSYQDLSDYTEGEGNLKAKLPLSKRYWQAKAFLNTSVSTSTPLLTDFTITAVSTGIYDSSVLFVGNGITSWGQFSAAGEYLDAIDFYVRSASYAFSAGDTSIPWTSQTNLINLSISTNPYVQVRVDSNRFNSIYTSTNSLNVQSITINWSQGETQKIASFFFDGRSYWSVNTSSEHNYNDKVLVYQRNNKWTIFDGPTYSTLGLYNNSLYAGDAINGNIYQIMKDGVYSDNLSAINSYVISKDFTFGYPNNDKTLSTFYVESSPLITPSTLSLGYSINKSTSYTTTSINIDEGESYNEEVSTMFPNYATGKYFNFKFSNNIVDEYMKIEGFTLLGTVDELYRR